MTMSSTEAKYVAVLEVCTDIMFVKMVMEFLGLKLERPITIHCDNMEAIFVGNTAKASLRTKHIDVTYHFIREYIVDRTVEVIFVPSEKNVVGIFTKNVGKETHTEHLINLMKERNWEAWDVLKQFNGKGIGNMKLFQYHILYLRWIEQ